MINDCGAVVLVQSLRAAQVAFGSRHVASGTQHTPDASQVGELLVGFDQAMLKEQARVFPGDRVPSRLR